MVLEWQDEVTNIVINLIKLPFRTKKNLNKIETVNMAETTPTQMILFINKLFVKVYNSQIQLIVVF